MEDKFRKPFRIQNKRIKLSSNEKGWAGWLCVCTQTIPVLCLLFCVIINCSPVSLSQLSWFGCKLCGHLNMGDKPKDYGVPKKDTITTGIEGLIKDISEEKFSVIKNSVWWTHIILGKLNKNELYLDLSGKCFN